jgi:hypothetical protein
MATKTPVRDDQARRALGVAAQQSAWPHPAHAAAWLHRGRPERKAAR